jgi:hypothetical protein
VIYFVFIIYSLSPFTLFSSKKMALRLLTGSVSRPYMFVARKSAAYAVYRGYASKYFFILLQMDLTDPLP